MMTLLGKQGSHTFVRFGHQVVDDDQMSHLWVNAVEVGKSLEEIYSVYGSIQGLIFTVTPRDPMGHGTHHVLNVGHESFDKHRFSTSRWSGDQTGKRMDPRHEVIWIGCVRTHKYVGIFGGEDLNILLLLDNGEMKWLLLLLLLKEGEVM